MGVKKAESWADYKKCFDFFGNMWEDEFWIELNNIEAFNSSDIFFLEKDNNVISSVQIVIAKPWFELSDWRIISENTPFILRIGTLEAYRWKGIGSVLLNEAIWYVKDSWYKTLHLAADSKRVWFYERFGFSLDSGLVQFKWNDIYYMKKVIKK